MDKKEYIEKVFNEKMENLESVQNYLNMRENWFLHNYITKINFLDSLTQSEELLEEMYSVAKKIETIR